MKSVSVEWWWFNLAEHWLYVNDLTANIALRETERVVQAHFFYAFPVTHKITAAARDRECIMTAKKDSLKSHKTDFGKFIRPEKEGGVRSLSLSQIFNDTKKSLRSHNKSGEWDPDGRQQRNETSQQAANGEETTCANQLESRTTQNADYRVNVENVVADEQ